MRANYSVAFLLVALSFLTKSASAQTQIQWQKYFQGYKSVGVNAISQTTDGGFIACGFSDSLDSRGPFPNDRTKPHIWVAKLRADGSTEWQKYFGGSGIDRAFSILQTRDGGYAVAAETWSNDGDILGFHGGYNDIWLLKLTASGTIDWQQCYGGRGDEFPGCIIQTSDGGYCLTGGTGSSDDGDVVGKHPNGDAWILKLTETGTIQWQITFGSDNKTVNSYGDSECFCSSVVQTEDGGFALAGWEKVRTSDFSAAHGGGDGWVAKINSSGELQWMKLFGGSADDKFSQIIRTIDGGFAAVGYSRSTDFDASDNHGSRDVFVVKLDASGNLQWHKCYGQLGWDDGSSILETADGYMIGASITDASTQNGGSIHNNIPGYHGRGDAWIVKISSSGDNIWQKCFGGSNTEYCNALIRTSESNVIFTGQSWSNDGDVSANTYEYAGWIVKLQSDAGITEEKNETLKFSAANDNITNTIFLHYAIAHPTDVNFAIYTITGQPVCHINDGQVTEGEHITKVYIHDLYSGSYCIRMIAGNNSRTSMVQIYR